jgi:hypothetical protein
MTRRDATLVHLELMWGTDPDTIAFLVRSTRSQVYWHLLSWGATEAAAWWRDVAWQEEPA